MEGTVEMMTESVAERGQSEPPPIAGCVDLLSSTAAENVNKSHVHPVPEESPTTYFNEHHCGNILKVLKQQQGKAELCDTLLIANSKQIPVHSCVIAANSPYFKALFDTSDFNRFPGQPLQIALPTTSSEVADNLIGYMYSGDISITTHCVEELLQLTDKLLMDDVRQCCELHMIKSIDLTNWSSSQVIAKGHGFQDLANEVIKFLAQNLMLVKSNTDFACLPSTDVLQVLNLSNSNEGSDLELCKLEFLLNWILFDYQNNLPCFGELLQCIKPSLLSTKGITKLCEELMKQELRDNELLQKLKTQVEDIENAEEEARRAAEEEVQRLKEEEGKRIKEEIDSLTNKEEESKEGEKKADEETEQVVEEIQTNENQEASSGAKESEEDAEGANVAESDKTSHEDSETEIEDNAECDNAEDKEKLKEVKNDVKDQKESSVVGIDGNQYLEDGTLIIQPQSAWQGRGKRKSYKPKRIYHSTGRPRGRPRKQLSAPDSVVAPPARRRGRPPLNRMKKKLKTKKYVTQTLTKTQEAVKVEEEACASEVDDPELLNDLELPEGDDNDPSWMPVPAEANPVDDEEIPVPPVRKRGRKRKALGLGLPSVMVQPIVKEKKKRGRKPNPGDKTYFCDKCPRSFKSMGSLSHHLKGHGSETPMLCEICGFSTRHYGSMNVHRRKHAGKVMHCPFDGCDHTEVHRARLDDHISAVHHGVKRHMCSICGKSFGAKKHLQRHEALHGKAKDIACNLCNYMTNRTDKLREHIRRHHPVVAVDMGMLKPEDLNKASPPKPRAVRKPKEPKQPKKKKGTRYDIHSYSEVENATEELEKKEAIETVTMQNVMVTNQTAVACQPSREPMQVQHTNPSVMVQMSHGHTMPSNMAPAAITHSAPIGVSNIPTHLLGTTTLSEEMIQYLASYTADQIHIHNQAPPGPPPAMPMEHQQPPNQPPPMPHHPHHPQHHPWPGTY